VDFDAMKDKATEAMGQHDDKVDQGLDRAGEAAKGRFGGHEEQIDQAVGRAQDATGGGNATEQGGQEQGGQEQGGQG
jgi:hypothetical protein